MPNTMAQTSANHSWIRQVGDDIVPIAGVYAIDPPHTMVEFTARQLMVSRVRGRFVDFGGTITVSEVPSESHVEVTIAAASVDTGDAERDAHLRSEDFLETDSFPTLGYRSTRLQPAGDGRWRMTGDLTVRGETREVDLEVDFLGGFDDPWGGHRIAFAATGEIDREQWGLTYNRALESGGVLVSKKVRLELTVTAIFKDSSTPLDAA